jgi:aminoglycoside N3'-acetyltransferase
MINSPPHYIHSDLFAYLSAFPQLVTKATSAEEIADKVFNAMFADLEDISNGRLIVPAYNYKFPITKKFNVLEDVSEVGHFSELFRKKFSGSRSYSPIFSNTANFSGFLCQEAAEKVNPFGASSDFAALVAANGTIVTFGSSFAPTFMIYIEKQVPMGLLYRYDKLFSGNIIDIAGTNHEMTLINYVRPRQIDILYDLDKVENDLKNQSILTTHVLRDTFTYSLCNAADFLSYALGRFEDDPLYFLTEETRVLITDLGVLDTQEINIRDFD